LHIGETVRLAVGYYVTECAGNWVPPVAAPGTVRISKGGQELYSAGLDYAPPGAGDGGYMYKDIPLTAPLTSGTLDVEVSLSWGTTRDTRTFQIVVAP
jgi:hypothetical protein